MRWELKSKIELSESSVWLGTEKIDTDGTEMEEGAHEDETVPDGMREWNYPITFEEYYSGNVYHSSKSHIVQTGGITLSSGK